MTCDNCIHERVCVIKAFPDAFENTQWEKEPCDHFKSKSEWISVEERLPDLEPTLIKWGDCGYKQKSIRVLCVCKQKSGKVLVKEGYYEVWVDSPAEPYWRIPGSIDSVTHWMPLPEAPKMKGGEE